MPWPKEYGGLGASPLQQMIFNEIMSYRRIPGGNMGVW
jgi:alkylation response protein AidB-like acyl-CoA dehydrogenase